MAFFIYLQPNFLFPSNVLCIFSVSFNHKHYSICSFCPFCLQMHFTSMNIMLYSNHFSSFFLQLSFPYVFFSHSHSFIFSSVFYQILFFILTSMAPPTSMKLCTTIHLVLFYTASTYFSPHPLSIYSVERLICHHSHLFLDFWIGQWLWLHPLISFPPTNSYHLIFPFIPGFH